SRTAACGAGCARRARGTRRPPGCRPGAARRPCRRRAPTAERPRAWARGPCSTRAAPTSSCHRLPNRGEDLVTVREQVIVILHRPALVRLALRGEQLAVAVLGGRRAHRAAQLHAHE